MFIYVAKRRYQLKKRAQEQRETRQRIVDATVALHGEIGPARTTISAIAERAGVQRLTVYRHFPDNRELFRACSERGNQQHPPPDPRLWSRIREPAARLEAALTALYGYYRLREPMLKRVLRDAEILPELAEALVPMHDYLESVAELVVTAWDVPRERRRLLWSAALHALRFETWRSFHEQGLAEAEAVDLMRRFVTATAESSSDQGERPTQGTRTPG